MQRLVWRLSEFAFLCAYCGRRTFCLGEKDDFYDLKGVHLIMIKRLICFLLVLLICISTVLVFTSCEGSESDHKCMKCGGSGKVRDEYGYFAYVSCPRCGGRGYLTY